VIDGARAGGAAFIEEESERAPPAGHDWTGALHASDLVLTPAACYPLYPLTAARGAIPAAGHKFDVAS
jgi:hypothetical protein